MTHRPPAIKTISIRELRTRTGHYVRRGCAHAHKLLEGIKVDLSDAAKAAGKTFPESFADYTVVNTWTTQPLPAGVKLRLRHEG